MILPIQNTMNTSNTWSTQKTTEIEITEVDRIELNDDYKQLYIDIE